MITKTQKLVLAAGLALNIAGIATVATVAHHRYVESHTIQLGTILVTPVDAGVKVASNGTVELAPVVVTQAHAADRYAANRSTGSEQAASLLPGIDAAVEALAALAPGQYLNTDTALTMVSTLAFDRAGR
ncbi:MAG TPA: hypothetical protein VFL15_10440 [Gammaproteobacteria bacterium]|nr:hypothetical protein [Gammaproteobacteria bacterium]